MVCMRSAGLHRGLVIVCRYVMFISLLSRVAFVFMAGFARQRYTGLDANVV